MSNDEVPIREDGVVVEASLRNRADPEFGRVVRNAGAAPTADGLRTDGRGQMIVFALPEDFAEAATVAVSFRLREFPAKRLGQIISAWCRPSDDPLRLVIEDGKLFARVEAGAACSTAGVPVELDRWHRAVAVRLAESIKLFVDGRDAGEAKLPSRGPASGAADFAVGGNPHFTGNEFLAADFRDLKVWARDPFQCRGARAERTQSRISLTARSRPSDFRLLPSDIFRCPLLSPSPPIRMTSST